MTISKQISLFTSIHIYAGCQKVAIVFKGDITLSVDNITDLSLCNNEDQYIEI